MTTPKEHWRRDKHAFFDSMAVERTPVEGIRPLAGLNGGLVTKDPICDSVTLLVEIPAGWKASYDGVEASLEFFVMRGRLAAEGRDVGPSGYIHLPQGCGGAELESGPGALAYVFWNPNLPSFPPPTTANLVTTLAAVPEVPTVRGVHGVWHKSLRIPDIQASAFEEPEFDGGPGGMLRVFFIGPGIDYPAEHSHMDCFEEIILIGGDCLLANEGLLGLGSVTTHPQEFWHGPFASRSGCLLLTHTDAPMGNPWPSRPVPHGYEFRDAYLNDEDWDGPPEHCAWDDIELASVRALMDSPEYQTWWKEIGHERFSNGVGRGAVSKFRASWQRDPEALTALLDSLEDSGRWRDTYKELLKDYPPPGPPE